MKFVSFPHSGQALARHHLNLTSGPTDAGSFAAQVACVGTVIAAKGEWKYHCKYRYNLPAVAVTGAGVIPQDPLTLVIV